MKSLTKILSFLVIIVLLVGCSIFSPQNFFPYNYQLLGDRATGRVLCGTRKCDAGSDGTIFQLNLRPYQPVVNNESDPHSIAIQVIGYITDRTDGSTPNACSLGTISPFKPSDVKLRGSTSGWHSDYERITKLGINVKAAVDADLDVLRQAGVLSSNVNVEELKGKIHSTYESLNTRTFKLTARYYTYGLDSDVFREVFRGDKYSECSAALRSGKTRLITSAGILWFEAGVDDSLVSNAATEIDTQLRNYGVSYSLKASVLRNVNDRLKANAQGNYQILVWRLAGNSFFSD